MKAAVLGMALAMAPVSVLALTTPKGGPDDPRVQTAAYRTEDVIELHATVGKALLVQLPAGEAVTDVTFSDTADILPPVIIANSVTLKPKAPIPPGPLFIYTHLDGGDGERIYKFELDATADPTGTDPIAIIITDPQAAAKARVASAEAAIEARRRAAIRTELDRTAAPPGINTDYTAQGPAALLGR
jgi:type IV secretory pathway VirB9-like protein